MESKGELMLIDLGDASAGNPVIDLIHSYMVFMLIGSGQQHSDDEMSFVDMTYGNMRRFWDIFLTTYCGDAEKAARLNEKLEPYAQMMYLTTAMAHPRLPQAYHAAYADKVRRLTLSRFDEILGSLQDALND